jgi:hypothetical protein
MTSIHNSIRILTFALAVVLSCTTRGHAQDCNLNGIADSVEIATCPGTPTCSDCNGNGLPDECDLAEQLGYTAAATYATAATRPTCLAIADYDGVNGPDLAVGTLDSNAIEFFFNDGNGSFSPGTSVTAGSGTVEIVADDFDGVGGVDIAAVHLLDFTVSVTVAVNDGSGQFTVTESVALGNGLAALTSGDFDGVGGPDIAVLNRNSQVVTILLNIGSGGFIVHNSPVSLITGDFPTRIRATDYDDDGKLDLVVTNKDDDSLSLYRNDFPTTGFLAGTTLSVSGTGPQGLVAGDFDGVDGEDLAVANEDSTDVTVLLDDNQTSAYLSHGPFSSTDAPGVIQAGDLNGDGSIDVATANFNDSSVTVLLNTGSGSLTRAGASPTTGLGPLYLVLADLDGDGDLDIATANRDGNSISVFFAVNSPPFSSDCQLDGIPDDCQSDCSNPPFAFCGNAVRLTNGGCEVQVSPQEINTSSFDPDGTDVQLSLNPPGPYPVGMTPVELIVEDSCCQMDNCFATVIVSDGDPPEISCPPTDNFGTNFACTFVGEVDSATAVDNCSASENIILTSDAPGVFPNGTTIVTWTATDESGNSSNCTQSIFVFDDDDPTVVCPVDRTLGTNLGCAYLGGVGQASTTDNCTSPATINLSNNGQGIFSLGETSVVWTATDAAGNSASCTQVVTIVDDDPPTITCPANQTVEVNVGCSFVGSFGTATAQDPCSLPGAISITNNAPLALDPGVTSVIWTATDEAGNSASCTQMVTVQDRTAPVIDCPPDVTMQTNTGCTYVGAVGTPEVVDNCTDNSALTLFNTAPREFPLGETTVVWVAIDSAGNTAVCPQLVTVVDDDAPTITCPADVVVEVSATCTFVGDIGTPVVVDNCSAVGLIAVENDAPLSFPLGETLVTWTAMDETGNTASCVQRVTAVDTIAPVINCPAESTVAAGADCRFQGDFGIATATDNCSLPADITVIHDATAGLDLGTTVVTWTATDEAGNATSCEQVVHVVDATAPDITCPTDIEMSTNLGCAFVGVLEGPTVVDNCSAVAVISVSSDAPTAMALGTSLVTWTATDEAGNSATCVQTVTIVDQEAPSITCPAAVTVGTNLGCTYEGTFGAATATDNCTAGSTIGISNDAPAALPFGMTVVTWMATDDAGNSATCTQLVTVEDTIAPEIVCPSAVTLGTNEGCAYRGPFGTPEATDNCAEEVIVSNDAPELLLLGTTLVTWTATDLAGNATSCVQEVIIEDDDAPEITCPAPTVVNTNTVCSYVGAIGQAVADDNCSSVQDIAIANDAPTEFPPGVTVVTWTATDAAGNVSSCTQEVTVVDDDSPVVMCPDEITVGTNTSCFYAGSFGDLTVSDNCSDTAAITISNDAPEELPLGTNSVTWTAIDEAGNQSSCTQAVIVVDDDAPTISCPSRAVRMTNAGCEYTGEIGMPVVTDNCTAADELHVVNDAPEFFPLGMTLVTWTATDARGNAVSCQQEVLVEDDDPPELECPQPMSFDINMGCSYVGPLGAPPVATDNCSPVESIVFSNDAPVAFPPGTTEVTWTVIDEAGNSTSCVQEIIIRDGIPPSLICPEVTLNANTDGCVYAGDLVPPIVTDNCSAPAGISLEHDTIDVLEVGTTVVTWVARDEDGNEVSCVTDVTVADRVPPQLTCSADLFVECSSQNGAAVEFSATVEDECDPVPTITFTPPSGSIFSPGVTVVFARATDASGNATTCTFSVSVSCEAGGFQLPGDCNQDGSLDISDPVCLLGFLFLGNPETLPCGSGGANDPSNESLFRWSSERIELSSAVQGLQFLFFGGAPNPMGQGCVQVSECPDACAPE